MVIGAYVAWTISDPAGLGWGLMPGLIIAVATSAALGLVINRLLILPFLSQPNLVLIAVMTTLSGAFFLENSALLIWGPRIKQLEKQLADKTNPFGKSKARDQAVAKKLAEPLPINFEANKLVNVLDYFRNTIGCNMYVDWRRLEQVSIEQDVPITMQLNNISAAHALKLVLLQGSVKTGEKTAAFQIVDGVIYISTRKGLKHLTQ